MKLIIAFLFLIPVTMFAQATGALVPAVVPPSPIVADTAYWIVALAAKFPIFISAAAVVGSLRFVFKALHTLVAYTQSKSDDAVLDKVEGSKVYKVIMFLVDYLASIKLPAQK